MKKKKGQQVDNSTSLRLPSCADLRGKQSVRATFKLTQRAINTINVVATHLGIKQKSLFDHLIDDARSLDLIASDIQSDTFDKLERVQKTYVVSRKTISCLRKTSLKFNAPRDALVEYSIQRLLPIIDEERKKHRKRKQILAEMTQYLKQGERIFQKAEALLGEDDPVCDRFASAITACRNAHRSIESFVEDSEIIEDF